MVAVVSAFGPIGSVTLGVAERERVIGWLHECLSDSKPQSMTLKSESLSLTRAGIGPPGQRSAYGAALVRLGKHVGLTEATAQHWTADLEAEQSGTYDTVDAEETLPIGD